MSNTLLNILTYTNSFLILVLLILTKETIKKWINSIFKKDIFVFEKIHEEKIRLLFNLSILFDELDNLKNENCGDPKIKELIQIKYKEFKQVNSKLRLVTSNKFQNKINKVFLFKEGSDYMEYIALNISVIDKFKKAVKDEFNRIK
jgi:hypothetical protein